MTGMWLAAGLLVLVCDTVAGKLAGENVCPEEHRYTINVTEYFVRNSTVRKYEWCLHVPPRCSFYTTKLINDSRVVEKEVVDVIDKCCSGYEEDKDSNTCKPICPDCVNGTCSRGRCECFPGYKGDLCHTDCNPSEWGENCQFNCTCERGSCDSKTGNCTCPSGWTGSRCQTPCADGFYGVDCGEECACGVSCHHVTGECEETTFGTTTGRTTFPLTIVTKKPTKTKQNLAKIAKNTIAFKNNGKFEIDKSGLLSTTSAFGITESPVTEDDVATSYKSVERFSSIIDDEERRYIDIFTTHGPFQIVKSPKAKVKEVSVDDGETSRPREENYLNDGARRGNINQPPVNKNDLVNSASAATAISVAIIIVAVVIVATNHFIRSKRRIKEDTERTKGVSTVSVYTHSIFHTPLPEPPTFENPIFITPAETNSNTEGQRFEARVVCSMNFPSHAVKDPRDYLYDHPPSTGSYRAASIPEPPDIEMSSVQSLTHGEPLYDEIPSGMAPTPVSQPPPSYKSSSLYMNTCGKTRL